MKLIKSTLLLAVAAIMAVGCQEGLRINGVDGRDNMGYLSLSALSVEVVSDHKPVDGEVSRAEATRADVDINTFDCTIYDESGVNNIIFCCIVSMMQ